MKLRREVKDKDFLRALGVAHVLRRGIERMWRLVDGGIEAIEMSFKAVVGVSDGGQGREARTQVVDRAVLPTVHQVS